LKKYEKAYFPLLPDTLTPKQDNGGGYMENRHNLIPYALEAVARPGSRESRVRKAPDGMRIRNERGGGDGR